MNLSNESKNTLTLTNESKSSSETFGDDPTRAFGNEGTFGVPGLFMTKESKNTLTLTNESKT